MIMDSSAGVCDILLGDHNQFYFFSLHFISFRFVASFHSFHSLVFSAQVWPSNIRNAVENDEIFKRLLQFIASAADPFLFYE